MIFQTVQQSARKPKGGGVMKMIPRRRQSRSQCLFLCTITILLTFCTKYCSTTTSKSSHSHEISLTETHPLGFLHEHLPLHTYQRVKLAPVVRPYLTIFANGSIYLREHLNYEKQDVVRVTVILENEITKG
jgi:hypothetical protein